MVLHAGSVSILGIYDVFSSYSNCCILDLRTFIVQNWFDERNPCSTFQQSFPCFLTVLSLIVLCSKLLENALFSGMNV